MLNLKCAPLLLFFASSAHAGQFVIEEADPAEFGIDTEQRPKIVDGYVIPAPSQRSSHKKNPRPGDDLPDAVYECVLDHVHGIGSDAAAQLVWQSCLRLHLK